MLFTNTVLLPIKKGIRQGDFLSPKLFTASLELVFHILNWEGGVDVNDEQFNHLHFADDVVLIENSVGEEKEMLQELNA